MTALEALACGVPVMSSREAGIIELVAGGGVLVEAEVGGIKRGLEEILSWSLEERRSRGAAALSLVQSRYDWRVVERRYAELYATL